MNPMPVELNIDSSKNENIITLRNKYLPNYYRAYPNHAKFEGLLSICNVELYKRLSVFISGYNQVPKQHLYGYNQVPKQYV
jgi:hypothetical protein